MLLTSPNPVVCFQAFTNTLFVCQVLKKNPNHPKQTTVKCAAKIALMSLGFPPRQPKGGLMEGWEGLGDIKPSHGR